MAVSEVAMADASNTVTGTVTYRERIALVPGSRVEVKLLDVSLQDVAARTLAEQTIEVTHQVPIPFELVYDPNSSEVSCEQISRLRSRAITKSHSRPFDDV